MYLPNKLNLRRTCKAVRNVVDTYTKSIVYPGYSSLTGAFFELSRWRWPNVTKMTVGVHYEEEGGGDAHRDFECFVTLQLPKLESLTLHRQSVLPLFQSNCHWPMLTYLDLTITVLKEESMTVTHLDDLYFSRWPLKVLKLCYDNLCGPEIEADLTLAFLGPFLQNCPDLNELEIVPYSSCPLEMATMIASAPLPQLHSFKIQTGAGILFWKELFGERNWPALATLQFDDNSITTFLPEITSKSWVTHLEDVYICNCQCTYDQLHAFFQALENGALRKLQLEYVEFDTFSDGIKHAKLKNLKFLWVSMPWPEGEPAGVDLISDLFDTCSFPKLEEMCIILNHGIPNHLHTMPTWYSPPSTRVEQLVNSFPALREMTLSGINISRPVADYLGNLRRQTRCRLSLDIDGTRGLVEEGLLCPARKQLLYKLGLLDLTRLKDFCQSNVDIKFYKDLMYWNCLSNLDFKRMAYGAALWACHSPLALEKFIKVVEEEVDNVFKEGALESIKTFLKEKLHTTQQYTTDFGLVVKQQLRWENIKLLIDYE